jgi:hypothetical protein
MGEMLTWVSANWQVMIGTAGAIVMAASIAVKAIAPLTDNTADDRAASWLDKVHAWLSKIALNPPKV